MILDFFKNFMTYAFQSFILVIFGLCCLVVVALIGKIIQYVGYEDNDDFL